MGRLMVERGKGPPSSPERPTLRPARATRTGPAVAPEPDVDPLAELELGDLELDTLAELVDEAEGGLAQLDPVLESGRPPDEPPRLLPTIGKFGDYAIVGRLALGGMAEILLAREEAAGAGSRYLVIKRILPEYEKDDAFVQMFLDEARVMMRLKHPNVVHVYKFGREDSTHYIAMEWVNGISLGKLIRRARDTGGIPLVVACKLISAVAEALEHAHDAKTEDGRELGIVHRDVTPDNIMISYEGSVKLLDFGIAKAHTRAHKTQAGVVKGKFAYMAPEQCRAKELDRRVDVFAMGVCLYEAITGRPLYRRATEFETMEAIVRGPVPTLSERVKAPPAELEAIIARCLAKKPDDRFSTAGELAEALDTFVAGQGKVVNARRIKDLVDHLFKEEQSRGPLVDTTPFGSSFNIASDPASSKFESGPSIALPDLPPPAGRDPIGLEGSLTPAYEGLAVDDAAIYGGRGARPGAPMDPTDNARPGGPSLSARAGTALVQNDPNAPTPRNPIGSHAPAPAPRRPTPSAAPSSGGGALKWIAIAVVAIGLVGGAAYFAMNMLMGPSVDDTPHGPVAAPVLTGTLTLDSDPSGAALSVDGRAIGPTPQTVPELSTGRHTVAVALDGYAPHEGSVEIRAGQTTTVRQPLASLTPPDVATPPGRLTLTSTPRAMVLLNGEELGRTPLNRVEVPSGVVALELVTDDGEHHRRGVMVRANEDNSAHLDLRQ
ncbi:MAG: protein kinase [Sandaracinaceae bacterium]